MNVYALARGVVRAGGVVHVVEDRFGRPLEALCGRRPESTLESARFALSVRQGPVDHRPVSCVRCLEKVKAMERALKALVEGSR